MKRPYQLLCNGIIGVLAVVGVGYLAASTLFEEDHFTYLAGHYYTASFNNRLGLFWYQDPQQPTAGPLLERVYEAQTSGNYLIARAGVHVYYLYPLAAASFEEAYRKQRGPFDRKEVTQELRRLTGDSVLHQVESF